MITRERIEHLKKIAEQRRTMGFVTGVDGEPFPISIPADEFIEIANLALFTKQLDQPLGGILSALSESSL